MLARWEGSDEQTVMFRGWGVPFADRRRSRTDGIADQERRILGQQRAAADQHAVGLGAEGLHLHAVLDAAEVDLAAVHRGDLAVGRLGDVHGHERPPARGLAASFGHDGGPSLTRLDRTHSRPGSGLKLVPMS